MRIRKVVDRPIKMRRKGIDVAGSLNAAIAANVNEPGAVNSVSTRSSHHIVQRNGRTVEVSDTNIPETKEVEG